MCIKWMILVFIIFLNSWIWCIIKIGVEYVLRALNDMTLIQFLPCLFYQLISDEPSLFFQLQVLIFHLVHLMVPINLECILQGSLCLVCPFHNFRVVPLLSRMPFQVVEQFMDLLELFLMSLLQEVVVLGLGVAVLELLLAVISNTSKPLSNPLELLGLLSTSLLLRIQIANHLLVVN